MITSAIVFLFFGVFNIIAIPIRLLPDASIPDDVIDSLVLASAHITAVNFIFPIDTFLLILATVLAVEGSIFLYKVFNWTIRKIPTIS